MDRRAVVSIVGGIALAAGVALVVAAPEPIDVPPAGAPAEAAAAAAPEAVPGAAVEAALPGVPTAEQEARMAAARPDGLPLQDALKEAEGPKQPEAWRPAVVAADGLKLNPPPGGGPVVPTNLPPDVIGIERLLLQRSAKVDLCMRWNAPQKQAGEDTVVVRFHLVPDGPTKGRIEGLTVPKDTGGRYDALLTCLTEVVAGAVFDPLRDPFEDVDWALNR